MLSLFLFIVPLILLLPWADYYNRMWDFLGRESGELRAALYRHQPTYDRLDYKGLRYMQTCLLLVAIWVEVMHLALYYAVSLDNWQRFGTDQTADRGRSEHR